MSISIGYNPLIIPELGFTKNTFGLVAFNLKATTYGFLFVSIILAF